jgi:hypothetical protein
MVAYLSKEACPNVILSMSASQWFVCLALAYFTIQLALVRTEKVVKRRPFLAKASTPAMFVAFGLLTMILYFYGTAATVGRYEMVAGLLSAAMLATLAVRALEVRRFG